MAKEKLVPCPACGRPPFIHFHTDPYFDQYAVYCAFPVQCGYVGPGIERTREEAMHAWNLKAEKYKESIESSEKRRDIKKWSQKTSVQISIERLEAENAKLKKERDELRKTRLEQALEIERVSRERGKE